MGKSLGLGPSLLSVRVRSPLQPTLAKVTEESRLESCLETDYTSRFARLVYRI